MKKTLTGLCLSILLTSMAGCSAEKETIPDAPKDAKAVLDFVKGKKLTVKSLGFYDNFTINDKKEVKWLDIKKEENNMIKEVATEEMGFSLQFVNDTAVTVIKKAASFTGTYTVDELTEKKDDEEPGIKLKLTYFDPEMSFGGFSSPVTYAFDVLGLDEKRMMLKTPRTINRQNLISMMSE